MRPVPPGVPLWPISLRGHFQRPSAAPPPPAALPKPEGPRPRRAALAGSRPHPERPGWAPSPDVPSSLLPFAASARSPRSWGGHGPWDAEGPGGEVPGPGRCEPGTNSRSPVGPAGVGRGEAELPRGAFGVAAVLGARAPTPVPSAPGRQRGGSERQGEVGVYPPGRGGLGGGEWGPKSPEGT